MGHRTTGQVPAPLYPHEIDSTDPGWFDKLLEFHRSTFGDSRMEDSGGAGDSGNGSGEGSGESTSNSDGDSGASANNQDGDASGDSNEGNTDEGKVEDLPKWAQDLIKRTRNEAAANRVGSRDAATKAAEDAKKGIIQDIGKALGLVKADGEDNDSEVDVKQIKSELIDSQRELAIYRSAPEDVKVQALLDSRSFMASIKSIPPTDGEALAAAIAKAVKSNPNLKTAPAADKSGDDLGGGSGENNKQKPTTLAGALDQHYA